MKYFTEKEQYLIEKVNYEKNLSEVVKSVNICIKKKKKSWVAANVIRNLYKFDPSIVDFQTMVFATLRN